MSNNGYAGNILHVDLTSGTIRSEPLDMDLARAFIGGVGLNNRLAYDIIEPGADAFSPDNPIILGTGPFAGTPIPGAGKVFATSKVPMSGAVATASGGGQFRPDAQVCRIRPCHHYRTGREARLSEDRRNT